MEMPAMQKEITEMTDYVSRVIYEQIEKHMRAFFALPGHEKEQSLLEAVDDLREQLKEAQELVNRLFRQGTAWRVTPEKEWQYDHMCIGIYESSQDYLIEHGLLDPKECMRK